MATPLDPLRPIALELRHFRLLLAIDEAGGITRAGERLHLTQSALSHQLQEIESRLGTPLFLRVRKRLQATEAGRRVTALGRRLLAEVVDLEEDLRGFASGRRGTLRLTTECYTCYEWLPPLLRRFERRHPEVEVEIVVEATREAVAALRAGRVDLALVTGTSGGDLVFVDLFEDELFLIVQPSHRLARRRFVRPADLLDERLLLYSKPAENHFYQSFLAPAGVMPREVSSVQLTEAIVSMVRAGLGVSPLAGWAVERQLRRGEVVGLSIGERGLHRTWRAATRRDARRPAYLDDFVALIAETAAPVKIERRRLDRRC